MLLRRVAEHVRQQHWTAIGIDLAIVVLGVFIGLQVANWNQAAIERARRAAPCNGSRKTCGCRSS
jgi:hypothetical protein